MFGAFLLLFCKCTSVVWEHVSFVIASAHCGSCDCMLELRTVDVVLPVLHMRTSMFFFWSEASPCRQWSAQSEHCRRQWRGFVFVAWLSLAVIVCIARHHCHSQCVRVLVVNVKNNNTRSLRRVSEGSKYIGGEERALLSDSNKFCEFWHFWLFFLSICEFGIVYFFHFISSCFAFFCILYFWNHLTLAWYLLVHSHGIGGHSSSQSAIV